MAIGAGNADVGKRVAFDRNDGKQGSYKRKKTIKEESDTSRKCSMIMKKEIGKFPHILGKSLAAIIFTAERTDLNSFEEDVASVMLMMACSVNISTKKSFDCV